MWFLTHAWACLGIINLHLSAPSQRVHESFSPFGGATGDSTSMLLLFLESNLPGVSVPGVLSTRPGGAMPLSSGRLWMVFRAPTEPVGSVEAILASSELRSPPRMGLGSRLSTDVKLKRCLAGRSRRLPLFVLSSRGEPAPVQLVKGTCSDIYAASWNVLSRLCTLWVPFNNEAQWNCVI